ncbi:type VI immunity family protein [Corallococcus sp. CA053C]|uniref:type VI immunity family protein n=1 Tax=Corallococcus sp. CA053C TaxID=2316732 RepID=UPI001F40228A|nr:type VI immunity family protein [Corallococcus sp. CA053C]
MRENIPIFRLRSSYDDRLVARDGIVVSFFIHREHEEVAPAIWRALQTYLHAIPPNSLSWYPTDDGDWDPLDDKGWEVIRKEMFERPSALAWSVGLFEDPGESRDYMFEYYGRRLDDPFYEAPATTVSFTFPTEYLLEHGPDHFRALVFKLAWELPFSFGYASLAVVKHHGIWGSPDFELLDAFLTRYLGMDFYHVRDTSSRIGAQARSASWLTFLGQPLLGRLGGIESLRRALPFPEVSLLSLDSQRLMITLSEWPDAIDTEKGGIPPQYRALALQLKPFVYKEDPRFAPDYNYQWILRLGR